MKAWQFLVPPILIAMALLGISGFVTSYGDFVGVNVQESTNIIPTDDIISQSNAIQSSLQGNTITSIPILDDILAIGGGVIGVVKLVTTTITSTWTLIISNVQTTLGLPTWFPPLANTVVILSAGLLLLAAFLRWDI